VGTVPLLELAMLSEDEPCSRRRLVFTFPRR
jgi:hypothetical protein